MPSSLTIAMIIVLVVVVCRLLKRMEHRDLPPCSPQDFESLSATSHSSALAPANSPPAADRLSTMDALPTAYLPSGVTLRRFAPTDAGAGANGGMEVGWLRGCGTRSVVSWAWEAGRISGVSHWVERADGEE